MNGKSSNGPFGRDGIGFTGMLVLLFIAVSAIKLWMGYLPGQTVFSNDGPLGRLVADSHQLPGRFSGCWQDLNLFGFREGTAVPGISTILMMVLRPVLYSKFYAPLGLTILGLGAWCFFRRLDLAPMACVLGALAAVWNTNFFSTACWGVVAHPITIGMCFFALAALSDTSSRLRWLRVALAGFAVGIGVIEGADVGAIFSLFVAAYAMYQAWIAEGSRVKNLAIGVCRVGLVAVMAGLVAAQSVGDLVATNIEGVAGLKAENADKQEHWDWATQWSLPKSETLGLVVPGLFGYLPDSSEGMEYWGKVGRAPAWDRYEEGGRQGKPPDGFQRYTGTGFYLGVTVAVLAFWCFLQSLRRQASVFLPARRKLIWFWAAIGVVSLLLAWGRFAPFYRLLYSLPYFSSIRNPVKFLDLLTVATIVLFAFGMDALCRKYMAPVGTPGLPRWSGLKAWWAKAGKFDKRWVLACGVVLGVSVVGWMIYASSRDKLEQYLVYSGISETLAPLISAASVSQVMWFVLFFVLMSGYLVFVIAGAFAGSRAKTGGVLLLVLLLLDLGRANLPWARTYDYRDRYASNSVLDLLRDHPWLQRVSLFPFVTRTHPILSNIYRYEWLQYQFPYYNIQALEAPQMSRLAEDLAAYQAEFTSGTGSNILRTLPRFWQLTNTRFVLGPADLAQALNMNSGATPWLRMVERFNTRLKREGLAPTRPENIMAAPDRNGQFALFEFTPALPRAVLYSQWLVSTNQADELKRLVDPAFDPARTVLVAANLPAAATNEVPGKVEITSYAPKDIVLRCEAAAPSVLLLNDHFDPNWKVFVDGKPDNMFRSNFYMRGVYVAAGTHTVEFRFRVRTWPLYVTAPGIFLGLLILGTVIGLERRGIRKPHPAAAPKPVAQNESAQATVVGAQSVTTKFKNQQNRQKRGKR